MFKTFLICEFVLCVFVSVSHAKDMTFQDIQKRAEELKVLPDQPFTTACPPGYLSAHDRPTVADESQRNETRCTAKSKMEGLKKIKTARRSQQTTIATTQLLIGHLPKDFKCSEKALAQFIHLPGEELKTIHNTSPMITVRSIKAILKFTCTSMPPEIQIELAAR